LPYEQAAGRIRRECIRTLIRAGFYAKRQEGSHIILRRDQPFAQVVVPDHKELDRGTLRAIIRQAGLTINQFLDLLKR
jgi:predicted RNA binding protein YcfA (HicA-like mRNA interferase family)